MKSGIMNIIYGAPKAQEIEEVKAEVGKVGFPEIIAAINEITAMLDNVISKQNALRENQDAMWNRIAALEVFVFDIKAEPSLKGRIEAIEMKLFGGIAQLEETAQTEQVADTPKSVPAPTQTAEIKEETKPEKRPKKSLMSKMFGGPEEKK